MGHDGLLMQSGRRRAAECLGRRTLLAFLLAALVGCGGSPGASVAGRVLLDGKPLARGTVLFHAVAGGPAASGQIGTDGRFELRTGRTEGLQPGAYVVTVLARAEPGGGPMEEILGQLLVPARYTQKARSPLRETVKPGKNQIDIAVQSD